MLIKSPILTHEGANATVDQALLVTTNGAQWSKREEGRMLAKYLYWLLGVGGFTRRRTRKEVTRKGRREGRRAKPNCTRGEWEGKEGGQEGRKEGRDLHH